LCFSYNIFVWFILNNNNTALRCDHPSKNKTRIRRMLGSSSG
jgi:hypothetical protein